MIGSISNMSSLAGDTMQRIPEPGQPLVSKGHPAFDATHDLGLETLVDKGRVVAPRVDLVAGQADRVVATIGDPLLHRPDVVLGRQLVALVLEAQLPAVRGGHDRDHRLAGHVAAHDQDVRLVEGAGVQELPPADLRAVDVGREEDPHSDASLPTTDRQYRSAV